MSPFRNNNIDAGGKTLTAWRHSGDNSCCEPVLVCCSPWVRRFQQAPREGVNMRKRRLFASIGSIDAVLFLLLAAMTSSFAQAQTYTVLHPFTNWPDGAVPNALMMGADDVMYGTTQGGGNHCGSGGCGTVYKIDSSGNETVLYRFTEGNDGANPVAPLIQDAAGNLYGNTLGNGFLNAPSTVFRIDTNGNETTLY